MSGRPQAGHSGTDSAPHLEQREGPDAVGGQLHRVQQRHLDQAVGVRPPGGPVLVTLHLWGGGKRCRDAGLFLWFRRVS